MRAPCVVVAVCLALSACAGTDPKDAYINQSAELTDPWRQMDLPLAGGEVLTSDPETCTFTFLQGEVADLAWTFAHRLERDGWAERERRHGTGRIAIRFVRDDRELAVSVRKVLGVVTVTLDVHPTGSRPIEPSWATR